MRSCFFFFQAEDGIRDGHVTGVQTCALPISHLHISTSSSSGTRATGRLTRTTRDRARCGTNESTNWAVWSHRVDIEEDKKLSWAALRERWPLFYCERRLLGCPYKGPGDSRPF